MKIKISHMPLYHGIHGHMAKTKSDLKTKLKLIDIVVEVLDARIPLSSSNKDIEELFKNKYKIIVLNKVDLADKEITKKWKKYFENQEKNVLEVCSNNSSDIKAIKDNIKIISNKILEQKLANKKINMYNICRVAIVGIPNVGKSTIINKLAKRETAKVSNKPGVTQENKWIRIDDNIDLLDTPGLLWPNINVGDIGVNLALTGNIKQEVLDEEELACVAIVKLINSEKYRNLIKQKYNLDDEVLNLEAFEILNQIGKNRGCIVSGGNVDTLRTSKIILDDLKNGKIGAISLEEC